jgi:hypothetical protein
MKKYVINRFYFAETVNLDVFNSGINFIAPDLFN